MENTDLLDDYVQVGDTTNNVDSVEPGSGKQLVDLTEYYHDTGQDNVDVMVSGIEELTLGVLSPRVAKAAKLSGVRNYDPMPSRNNARLGAEGFLSNMASGFRKFIENIIKYVKMAINWVVNLIKGVLGFRKSERITNEVSKKIEVLEKEFGDVMRGFGFPEGEFDVIKYMEGLDPSANKHNQVTLLVNKMARDEEHITNLRTALPLITDCIKEINKLNDNISRESKKLSREIDKVHKKVVAQKNSGDTPTVLRNSPEALGLRAAILKVDLAFDLTPLDPKITAMLEALAGVEFKSEELRSGMGKIIETMKDSVEAQRLDLLQTDIPTTVNNINFLSREYHAHSDNSITLSGVDWKAVNKLLNVSEAEKIEEIQNWLPLMKSGTNQLSPAGVGPQYTKLAQKIRDFTAKSFLISNQMLKLIKQINQLEDWYWSTLLYYRASLLDDVIGMQTVVANAKAKGHSPVTDPPGSMAVKLDNEMLTEAQAQGFYERFAEVNNEMINQDIGGLKTSYEKLIKQLGFKKR